MKTLRTAAAKPAFWPVLCYTVCILVWLLSGVYHLAADSLLRATGALAPFELTAADFTLADMTLQPDGTLLTLTDDPQMHWQNPDGLTVRTLRMSAEFSKSPREMCLYYTTRDGEDFSSEKRVFAVQQPDGSYLYTLPSRRITALRLDPCSARSLTITPKSFTFNEAISPLGYFTPGWYGLYRMILWPALAACALRLAQSALAWLRNRKGPAAKTR